MKNATKLRFFLSALTVLVVFSAGAFRLGIISGTSPSESVEASLEATVIRQANAWNQGDLVQFMSAYWKNDQLTFSSGGETHRGWQVTLDRYQTRYPDRATMGKLTFSHLETQLLGIDSALMLGQWHLEREKPVEGNFSLVWKKVEGNWFIIHDHSSSLEAKN